MFFVSFYLYAFVRNRKKITGKIWNMPKDMLIWFICLSNRCNFSSPLIYFCKIKNSEDVKKNSEEKKFEYGNVRFLLSYENK